MFASSPATLDAAADFASCPTPTPLPLPSPSSVVDSFGFAGALGGGLGREGRPEETVLVTGDFEGGV